MVVVGGELLAAPDLPMRFVMQTVKFVDARGEVSVDFCYSGNLKKIVVNTDGGKMTVPEKHLVDLDAVICKETIEFSRSGGGLVLAIRCKGGSDVDGNYKLAEFVFEGKRYTKRITVIPQVGARPRYIIQNNE